MSLRAASRSANFWILPVEVFGNGPKTTEPRRLEVGEQGAAMLDQLRLGSARPIPQRDEGARAFAPALVGPGDDRRLEHGRMAVEGALDLDRGDVLARPR